VLQKPQQAGLHPALDSPRPASSAHRSLKTATNCNNLVSQLFYVALRAQVGGQCIVLCIPCSMVHRGSFALLHVWLVWVIGDTSMANNHIRFRCNNLQIVV
jgi:hypothetical protein